MFCVKLVTRPVGNGRAGKDMATETGYRLLAVTKKFIYLTDLAGIVIANLLLADKLQLGLVQPDFIHHVDGMR